MIAKILLVLSFVSFSHGNDKISCDYDLTESIPQGLFYPPGTTYNSTHDEFISLINNANSTLHVASFYWSLRGKDVMPDPDPSSKDGEEVLEAFVNAAKRGVQLQIAVDSKQTNLTTDVDIQMLKEAGAEIRPVNFTKLMGAGVLHTKFIIADSKTFYVGSANMDWRSLTQVKELGITVFNCPNLALDIEKIFQVYWTLGQSDEIPTSWPESLSTNINVDNPLSVKFGNDDSLIFMSSSPKPFNPDGRTNDIDAILSAINSAKKYINIAVMDYYPLFLYQKPTKYWPIIDDALRRAAIERGVNVRILGSYWKSTRPIMFNILKSIDAFYDNKYGKMEAKMFKVPANASQAQIPYARVNHNKYMVTDEVAYIGTSNWSADYFVNTGGVGFVVRETNVSCYQTMSLRQKLTRVFERDWNSKYAHYIDNFRY